MISWSGLRGRISFTLTLSLYDLAEGQVDNYILDLIIAMTYSVVLFSIIVQGLTVKKLFGIYDKKNPALEESEEK